MLDGTAKVVRGEYDFAGKRFEFDEDGVVYLAASAAHREDAHAFYRACNFQDGALRFVKRLGGA